MTVQGWLDRTATAVLVACALVSCGILIKREMFTTRSGSAEHVPTVRAIANADSLARTGRRLGPSTATLTLVEFGDFECPACRVFHQRIARLERRYPGQLAIAFHHYPLEYHRFAFPAARAAECANDQGRFEAYHDILYDKQDSLGLISFTELAKRAGVADTARFVRCTSRKETVESIAADVRAGTELRLPGTPAVLLAGQLSSEGPPSIGSIEAALKRSKAAASTSYR